MVSYDSQTALLVKLDELKEKAAEDTRQNIVGSHELVDEIRLMLNNAKILPQPTQAPSFPKC